ncbi:serine hydrolase domain-containing protein [Nonlabens marinus]|uniref:Beta-lactamase n=1 Tax=Nonlabens marinus S1-08 TaxID=1454201 RepID=W8VS37_9FLAO|nr:serine hydrolase domain-containing protein [Nonlabens marinus]BAO56644.1 beta-lactamase [Nonlabens marinus S1-08]
MKSTALLLLAFICLACSSQNDDDAAAEVDTLYFPSLDQSAWETMTPTQLKWDDSKLQELYGFLEQNETRAFIVLKNGKMVVEKYWGKELQGSNNFDQNSNWYWASAGKSLTAVLIGIAQENENLNIDNQTSIYLGTNWSSMPIEKENLITVRNHLTLTTGADFTVPNLDCTTPGCILYLSDAGTQWYYHNATYTILHQVLESATNQTNNEFTTAALKSKTGMDGSWVSTNGFNEVFFSTPRSAARFGLLILNKGTWAENEVLGDQNYFSSMTTASQPFNASYGYLWWLNGKESVQFPLSTNVIPSSVTPSAPEDMISALGKNGQFIDVAPSQGLVVVRMGDSSNQEPVPILFHEELWKRLYSITAN